MQLGFFEVGEEGLDEAAEAALEEVVAAGRPGDEADAGLAEAVGEEPGVELGAQRGQGGADIRGVGGDDQKLAGGVGDLGGGRQAAGFKYAQGGQLGEQRDLEGAAAQQAGGRSVGLGAIGEDEVLDAEEVALDEEELGFVPVAAGLQGTGRGGVDGRDGGVPAPQGGGEGGGGLAVVVEGDVGLDAEGGGRRDGVGEAEPGAVEVVEPQGPGVPVGAGLGLIMLEPDFGSFVVVTVVALGLLFLAGLPWRWFLMMVGAGLLSMIGLIAMAPYRVARVTAFLNPWEDPLGKGYQLTHSLMAIARGEWFGVGLGASLEKRFYLPEAHTDFILAVIGEEFGMAGICVLIFCYGWLVWRAFSIGKQARDLELYYGAFVAKGVGIWLGIQSFFNIGVNIGLLPTKGLTLPLMSYGGSAVIVMLVSMTLLLRVDYENRLKMRGYKVEG